MTTLSARALRELQDADPDLRRRVLALADACPFPLGVTSVWRSYDEQQRLYTGWVARKPGFNPANPPGHSKHEATDPPSDRHGRPAAQAVDLDDQDDPRTFPWCQAHAAQFGLVFPYRTRKTHPEPWHTESNGRSFTPPAPPEDIVASKAELQQIVRDEINRLSGGPRRADRNDTDPKTISVADVLTEVEELRAAVGETNTRLARIEAALGSGS